MYDKFTHIVFHIDKNCIFFPVTRKAVTSRHLLFFFFFFFFFFRPDITILVDWA